MEPKPKIMLAPGRKARLCAVPLPLDDQPECSIGGNLADNSCSLTLNGSEFYGETEKWVKMETAKRVREFQRIRPIVKFEEKWVNASGKARMAMARHPL